MSAPSGIAVSDELVQSFNTAINDEKLTRFIIASIRGESIVPLQTIQIQSTFEDDLSLLQSVLDPDTPAYILARFDPPSSSWLAISYIPDTANIRSKMLYASSRASFTKGLGSGYFIDNLFATSKADLTAESYAAHRAYNTASKPLTEREQEIEDAKAAQKDSSTIYEGSRARKNHLGKPIGFAWDSKAEEAVQAFLASQLEELLILTIDIASETLILHSQASCSADEVAGQLPTSTAAYALSRFEHTQDQHTKHDIIFIYSCPVTSPIKHRMIYSSGTTSVVHAIQSWLNPGQSITKRIELSDPRDFDQAYLREQLGYTSQHTTLQHDLKEDKVFARPRAHNRQKRNA